MEKNFYDLILKNHLQIHKWFHNHMSFLGYKKRRFFRRKGERKKRKHREIKTIPQNRIKKKVINIMC